MTIVDGTMIDTEVNLEDQNQSLGLKSIKSIIPLFSNSTLNRESSVSIVITYNNLLIFLMNSPSLPSYWPPCKDML